MNTREMESRIRELRELQALIEEAQAEAEAIKADIKAQMGAAEEIRVGEYKVTWKPVEAVRFDSKALKATLPDVYAAFTRTSTTRRFCVV